eukprot:TRINITY_DN5213_c0_g1_i3.p1 TRINITY_DN5213_c0_g1~~TRINITY_DN5213_c0_g1_i3.p1  ORF type:complete len:126 (-),score=22.47 TRINITY_DN5213_c0_g1_i3:304-630(-)
MGYPSKLPIKGWCIGCRIQHQRCGKVQFALANQDIQDSFENGPPEDIKLPIIICNAEMLALQRFTAQVTNIGAPPKPFDSNINKRTKKRKADDIRSHILRVIGREENL